MMFSKDHESFLKLNIFERKDMEEECPRPTKNNNLVKAVHPEVFDVKGKCKICKRHAISTRSSCIIT